MSSKQENEQTEGNPQSSDQLTGDELDQVVGGTGPANGGTVDPTTPTSDAKGKGKGKGQQTYLVVTMQDATITGSN